MGHDIARVVIDRCLQLVKGLCGVTLLHQNLVVGEQTLLIQGVRFQNLRVHLVGIAEASLEDKQLYIIFLDLNILWMRLI